LTMKYFIKTGLGCAAVLSLGCGEESGQKSGTGSDGPLYAMMSNVYVDEDRTVYVAVTDSLDVEEVSLDEAHEFPGVANFEAIGGRLLVSSGDAPTITEYDVSDDFVWTEGRTLSFAEFPLTDNANFFSQFMVDEQHMYLPFDGYKRVVWNPTDFVIDQVLEDSALEPERDGMPLEPAGNRTGIRYEGAVMMPFFYHDEDWFEFADSSPIAVYDPKTHVEEKVLEAPCPGLAIASQDEQGNTYFSTWDYGPLRPLYGLGPAPCVVRVTPDHELDEAFTTDFSDLTEDRFVSNFQYVRDGWGLANVLHHERLAVAPVGNEVPPELFDNIWDDGNWSVWRFDLEAGTAEPFTDIELSSFGWGLLRIDGRSLLSVCYDDYSRTKFYELAANGSLTEHLDVVATPAGSEFAELTELGRGSDCSCAGARLVAWCTPPRVVRPSGRGHRPLLTQRRCACRPSSGWPDADSSCLHPLSARSGRWAVARSRSAAVARAGSAATSAAALDVRRLVVRQCARLQHPRRQAESAPPAGDRLRSRLRAVPARGGARRHAQRAATTGDKARGLSRSQLALARSRIFSST
jgi:hypothetical protein